MSEIGIPFGFDTYGTKKGGLNVGQIVYDAGSNKSYMFVQAHSTFSGSAFVAKAPAIQQSATIRGIVTDKASIGLDTTYPICCGAITSAMPVSVGSTTVYYGWAQYDGFMTALVTDGDTVAAGDELFAKAADPSTFDSLAGTATNTADGVLSNLVAKCAAANSASTVDAYIKVKAI